MASLGVIGLGTMGKNLALNVASKKTIPVHIYNRTFSKVTQTINEADQQNCLEYMKGCHDPIDVIMSSDTTMIMLPHGKPFDDFVKSIKNDIPSGYTLIDGANEHYTVSQTRGKSLDHEGINYLGVGVSGGAEGARNGPCMMIGGSYDAYLEYEYIFNLIANGSNYGYYGKDYGIGHFVKTVHNGIEYAMLQCICEVYHIFGKDTLNSALYHLKHEGYESTICDITKLALNYDLENIKDVAKMNSTGMWCIKYANEKGISIPMINAAVDSRIISSLYRDNNHKSHVSCTSTNVDYAVHSIKFGMACALYEGELLVKSYGNLDYNMVMSNWKKGAILSSNNLHYTYKFDIQNSKKKAGIFVNICVNNEIPCPAISSALNYHNSIECCNLPVNLLMAQRNVFGEHPIEYK